MIPQTAERRADNSDSRIADKITSDEFAIAQKILRIFIFCQAMRDLPDQTR